jgi:hypothetical protein
VTFSYSNGKVTVTTEYRRGVGMIVQGLQERYRWKVNYEDVPIVYRGDYDDLTSPNYVPKSPDDRALDPRRGRLTITFAAPSEDGAPADPLEVLTQLTEASAAEGLPGRFQVRKAGDQYDVVGTQVADEAGVLRPVPPLLDTPVTLAKEDRTVADLIRAVADSLSASAGRRVARVLPLNVLGEHIDQGFTETPAREVIRAALAKAGGDWVWILNYQISSRTYYLNINRVW